MDRYHRRRITAAIIVGLATGAALFGGIALREAKAAHAVPSQMTTTTTIDHDRD